jgi:hypothetical protein
MAIWVFKDGVREGPYEERDIRELIYEGTYSDADMAERDGDPKQCTVGEILGRAPAGAPAPERLSSPVPAPLGMPATSPPTELPSSLLPKPGTPPPLPAEAAPAPATPTAADPIPLQVTVVDFGMPFGSMVVFMVKWILAAIPAFLILGIVVALFWAALFTFAAGVFSSLLHR